jgi:N-acetylneuraminate synthase
MEKPKMQIAGRKIGYHYNPIVLAEIGINHEGILQTAIEMVEAAISAGAEIIKHQTHVVEDEMSDAAKKTIPGNSPDSIYDIMDRCSLNEEEEWELKRYTESRGAIFISTPFSRAAVDRLAKFEVPAFKIGSGECNNYPLLEYICSFRKPIILSTGMNNLVSVRKAVKIIRKHKIPFALLHTTNLYPTPPDLVRLGALADLEKAFPDAVIGLSDHTTNNLACLGAVALGASILERHFTDSKDRKGPDIVCSMTPDELSELIASSKVLKLERGGNKKDLLREEQVTRNFAFATVVTIKPIKEGEIFSKENLWVKRPGTGKISAAEFINVIGKRAARDIMTNVHLDWSDIR